VAKSKDDCIWDFFRCTQVNGPDSQVCCEKRNQRCMQKYL